MTAKSFTIEELADRYRITPVKFRARNYSFELSKEKIQDRKCYNQHMWQHRLISSEWNLPTAPDYLNLMMAVYEHRDTSPLAETLRDVILSDYKRNIVLTGTKVVYNRNGIDEVTHYEKIDGQNKEQTIKSVIAGPERTVTKNDDERINALLGIKDAQTLKDMLKWYGVRHVKAYTNSSFADAESAACNWGYTIAVPLRMGISQSNEFYFDVQLRTVQRFIWNQLYSSRGIKMMR